MGSTEGALRAAATRVGLTPTEYIDRLNAGLLWCTRDQAWEPAENFGIDRSRTRGRAASCRRSTSAAARSRYARKPRPNPGRSFIPARGGDRRQARRRVNHLVAMGVLPSPSLPCHDCGHAWSPGQRRHEYDHHLGYAAEHHEDVQAVCTTCHHARENLRRNP